MSSYVLKHYYMPVNLIKRDSGGEGCVWILQDRDEIYVSGGKPSNLRYQTLISLCFRQRPEAVVQHTHVSPISHPLLSSFLPRLQN